MLWSSSQFCGLLTTSSLPRLWKTHTLHTVFYKKAMYLKIKTNHTIDFNMPLHATPHLEDEALMVRGQTVNSGRVSGYYPRPLPPLLSFIPWPWRWENMKASSPPSSCLLITLRRILSIAIAHLSSFVSPPSCVPIQSIFISLLGSFNSCFHCRPDRSIFPCLNLRPSPFQLARWGAPSHFLHLSVTSLLLIPFNLPRFYFPLRLLLPSQYFFFFHSLLLAYFSPVVDVFLSTPSLPLCQLDLLYPSILAKGGLSGPIKLPGLMSIPTLHSLGPTGQFIWSKGRQGASTR